MMVSKSGYFLTTAILIRLLLVICGSGIHLQQRMEVMSTNDDPQTAAETRFLLFRPDANLSVIPPPLQTPPLLLLLIPTDNILVRGLINIVVDILAALSLFTISSSSSSSSSSQPGLSPSTVAALFLCNPLTIASCISGSAATLTLGLTIISIHLSSSIFVLGAVIFGLACHVAPTSFSLLPAILLLLYNNNNNNMMTMMRRNHQSKAPTPSFISTSLMYCSVLLLTIYLSVIIPSLLLSSSSSHGNTPTNNNIKQSILMWGQDKLLASLPPPLRSSLSSSSSSIVKAVNVAAGAITNPPPNLGLQWYLLVEVFPMYKPLFEYVIRMLPAALAIPIALRFTTNNNKSILKDSHATPLSSTTTTTTTIQLSYLVLSAQAAINAMLSHHPTYGSIALWMAFLPLTGIIMGSNINNNNNMNNRVVWVWLGVGMPVCLALCTATHNVWLVTGMANVNFFYGMTLVWGLWQVAFIIQLLKAGVTMEVRESLGYKKMEEKKTL